MVYKHFLFFLCLFFSISCKTTTNTTSTMNSITYTIYYNNYNYLVYEIKNHTSYYVEVPEPLAPNFPLKLSHHIVKEMTSGLAGRQLLRIKPNETIKDSICLYEYFKQEIDIDSIYFQHLQKEEIRSNLINRIRVLKCVSKNEIEESYPIKSLYRVYFDSIYSATINLKNTSENSIVLNEEKSNNLIFNFFSKGEFLGSELLPLKSNFALEPNEEVILKFSELKYRKLSTSGRYRFNVEIISPLNSDKIEPIKF